MIDDLIIDPFTGSLIHLIINRHIDTSIGASTRRCNDQRIDDTMMCRWIDDSMFKSMLRSSIIDR
jgi:hypothetical protein